MPSLMTVVGADSRPFARELTNVQRLAQQFGKGIRGALQAQVNLGLRGSASTIVNPRQAPDAMRDYGQWWKQAMAEQEAEQKAAKLSSMAWIRSLRERRKERDLEKAKIAEAAAAEAKAADLARIGWIRSLRERRKERAAELAEIAKSGAAEAKAAELARIAWIRMLRERRKERAAERAEEASRTGVRGWFNELKANAVARVAGPLAVAYGAIQFTKAAIQADIAMARMQNTLKAVAGSAALAEQDFKYLRGEADRVGFSFLDIGDDFARFSLAGKQAGLSRNQTKEIFSSVTSAGAAMGLDSARQGQALLALEQMLSKTTVSMQELRLQLGNAMPAAVNVFAQALGVSTAKLFEMVESGDVLAKDALPKFAEQLNKTFPLRSEDNKTARDIARVSNAWTDVKAGFGELIRRPLGAMLEGTAKELKKFKDPIGAMAEAERERTGITSEEEIEILRKERRLAEKERERDARFANSPDFRPKNRPTDEQVAKAADEQARFSKAMEDERFRRSMLAAETDDERASLVRKRIKEMESELFDTVSGQPTNDLKLEIEKAKTELAQFENKEKPSSKFSQPLTDQQQHGAFVAFGTVTLLDVNKQQLQVLQEIKRELKSQPQTAPRRGVNFGGRR